MFLIKRGLRSVCLKKSHKGEIKRLNGGEVHTVAACPHRVADPATYCPAQKNRYESCFGSSEVKVCPVIIDRDSGRAAAEWSTSLRNYRDHGNQVYQTLLEN
ncbi:Hypothetical predicted protein [Xyrichtys novacula]|uniref:Uncharacterized protein n=1 Tax=Xyrichtys novacula TaxID=13765 RepID=A0AAV1H5P1_XYRNO|nr:Hypothetical predicted protein [Xyrichtys novacula]